MLFSSLPIYQRFLLLLLQRHNEEFYCSKCDFNTGKDAALGGTWAFSVQSSFLGLGFLTQICPGWASCSPALTLPWNWFFSPTFTLTPAWVLSKAGTVMQVVLGTITLFLPAKGFAGHVAAFLTLGQSKMQSSVSEITTPLLLEVFWSSVLPELCAAGQMRVLCLILRKSSVRVREEITPLTP